MHQTFWSWQRQGAFFLICQILVGWILVGLGSVRAKDGEQVFISGFQVSGGVGRTNEEYIEIFNGSGEAVDLVGWRLAKLTKTGVVGSWTYLAPSFSSGTSLAAFSFAVAVHNEAGAQFSGDWDYASSTLAEDNSVALLNAAGEVVDLVGWGQAINNGGQVLPAAGTGRWSRELLPGDTLGPFVRVDSKPRQGKISALVPVVLESTTSTEQIVELTTTTTSLGTSTEALSLPTDLQDQQKILISEVYPQPETGQSEYVELYNPNNNELILDNWHLSDGGGNETVVTGTIRAKEFMVISPVKGGLNNTGDNITLWQDGEKVDGVVYGDWEGAAFSPGKGESLVRLELSLTGDWMLGKPTPSATNTGLTQAQETEVETAAENSFSKTTAGPKLKISEILPNPDGLDETEFIELFNPTTQVVAVGQWRLEVGEQEFIIPDQTLFPGTYVVFTRAQSKLVLPNLKKLKINLVRADGTISDSVGYTVPAVSAASWVDVPGRGWEWSQSSTPGSTNVWKQLNRQPYAEITAPKEVTVGEVVDFDSDNVYDPDQDLLAYRWDLGDGQTTTGTGISTVYAKAGKYKVSLVVIDPYGLSGEADWLLKVLAPMSSRLIGPTTTVATVAPTKPTQKKVASAPKKKTSATTKAAVPTGPALPVAARLLSVNDGRLVKIKGVITGGSGKYWRLDDSTDEVVVILPAAKQPSGFGFKKGTTWEITGVVKKYKDDWAVAPSAWNQLQLLGTEVGRTKKISAMPVSVNKVKALGWAGGLLIIIVVSVLFKKRKRSALIPISVV